MRTIAIAASFAIIAGGGTAGILVGGAGAQMARDYSAPVASRQPAMGTTAMNRAPRSIATDAASEGASPDGAAPAELRLGHDANAPSPVTMDMNAVFPEPHGAPARAANSDRNPRMTVVRPPRSFTRPAERVQAAPTQAHHVAAAPKPAPAAARVAAHTTPSRTAPAPARSVAPPPAQAQSQTHNQAAAPAPARARPARTARHTPRPAPQRAPARAAATPPQPAPAAAASVEPHPLPPSTAAAPGVSSPPSTVDATRRTTMSQGGGAPATEPPPVVAAPAAAPAQPSPAPATSAPAPAPVSDPSTLLANP